MAEDNKNTPITANNPLNNFKGRYEQAMNGRAVPELSPELAAFVDAIRLTGSVAPDAVAVAPRETPSPGASSGTKTPTTPTRF